MLKHRDQARDGSEAASVQLALKTSGVRAAAAARDISASSEYKYHQFYQLKPDLYRR